jgi:hypothetical protein
MRKMLLSVVLLYVTAGFSQNQFKRNTIYGELAGSGLFLSANYERQLSKNPGLGIHIGTGWGDSKPIIPFGLTYLFKLGNNKSFVEAGATITLTEIHYLDYHETDYNYTEIFFPSIGYRHHTNYGLMWKITYSPSFSTYGTVIGWGGFSLGWRI